MSYSSEYYSESDCSSDENYCGNHGEEFRGNVINNNYALIEKIGYGSFSSVWLAYSLNNDKYYAIKIQNAEDYDEGIIELKILKKIKSIQNNYMINLHEGFEIIKKNITKKNNYSVKKFVCMVLPLMAGSVYSLIKEGKYKDGLNDNLVLKSIKALLNSTRDLHNKLKICHTDLKPENMLISGLSVKVNELIDEYNKFNLNKDFNNEFKKKLEIKKWDINNKNHKNKIRKLKKIILKECHKNILKNIIIDNDNSSCEYKYVNDSDSKSTNSESSDSEVPEFSVIDDKYLNDCNIIINDFGNSCKINDLDDDEVQTRYYRAPEVILGLKATEKIDIWSIGCILYEIYTGHILFDPQKDNDFSRDFHHLFLIEEISGKIPKSIIKKSPKRKEFFKNYKLNCKKDVKQISLESLISKTNIKIDNIIISLMKKCLIVDPDERPDINEVINIFNTITNLN